MVKHPVIVNLIDGVKIQSKPGGGGRGALNKVLYGEAKLFT